ncbi:Nif3-like dinuclear metal center hexameric protein [Rhabdobacter roseus]|uniref:GTP cyclohydrolase 1 type 2 homolog n=1 Tax=Rhabdobacter roseus TaxID=1655419 RepID=A0A840TFR6_9BACT|nr:Nif3-like dinuclear metal center hexameric protein [Rhabdobacter roseus]MBB5282986.1 dinuclear metal center YbgI/SA1388 family protein [Rhabdobacter roseus]
MTQLHEIIQQLERWAPPAYQESYDNAGLIVGDPAQPVRGVLCSLDCTEAVVDEAIQKGCNVVVAHHPIVFKGLKSLTGRTYVERTVLKAIKHDVALYAIHTNLDSVVDGVNWMIAARLGLQNVKVLAPKKQLLMKLTTFVPLTDTPAVLEALYAAGAGRIGEYSGCSFRTLGTGTFTPGAAANPTLGTRGEPEEVQEHRVEVLFSAYLERRILSALREAHPYEEVAYYLHTLENENQEVGAGAVGELPEPLAVPDFLRFLKEKMETPLVKYTEPAGTMVRRVAVCGGVGSFLLPAAKQAQADAFVTADYKYHEFFDAEGRLMICDIGHYESEVHTKDILYKYLSEKFDNFALYLSEVNTNPVRYFW